MTPKKDMNQKRYNFGITYNDEDKDVYVLGGQTAGGYLDHVEKYSVELDVWTELEPMTKQKSNVSACMVNN